MAEYRKLGKKTKLRKAILRSQVTQLLYRGRIVTTEARAKEVQKIVEPMITLAVKESGNYETVKVQAKQAVRDKDGKRVKEVVDGKKVAKFETVEKEIKKDLPSRLHARRQLLRYMYPVVEVPTEGKGRKKNTKEVDLVAKMFDEYGPRFSGRNGGYTRIIKIGQRKGDAALMVVLELV
ncbi:MAG: 50S ribosomal protein L17 [Lachnospiraceae bacterium]|nr:50S ribosomal protein L17 [Lachnospiraceae bacterium]